MDVKYVRLKYSASEAREILLHRGCRVTITLDGDSDFEPSFLDPKIKTACSGEQADRYACAAGPPSTHTGSVAGTPDIRSRRAHRQAHNSRHSLRVGLTDRAVSGVSDPGALAARHRAHGTGAARR